MSQLWAGGKLSQMCWVVSEPAVGGSERCSMAATQQQRHACPKLALAPRAVWCLVWWLGGQVIQPGGLRCPVLGSLTITVTPTLVCRPEAALWAPRPNCPPSCIPAVDCRLPASTPRRYYAGCLYGATTYVESFVFAIITQMTIGECYS